MTPGTSLLVPAAINRSDVDRLKSEQEQHDVQSYSTYIRDVFVVVFSQSGGGGGAGGGRDVVSVAIVYNEETEPTSSATIFGRAAQRNATQQTPFLRQSTAATDVEAAYYTAVTSESDVSNLHHAKQRVLLTVLFSFELANARLHEVRPRFTPDVHDSLHIFCVQSLCMTFPFSSISTGGLKGIGRDRLSAALRSTHDTDRWMWKP